MFRKLRDVLHHMFNPAHVYCRLNDVGMSKTAARRLCSIYERFVWRHA